MQPTKQPDNIFAAQVTTKYDRDRIRALALSLARTGVCHDIRREIISKVCEGMPRLHKCIPIIEEVGQKLSWRPLYDKPFAIYYTLDNDKYRMDIVPRTRYFEIAVIDLALHNHTPLYGGYMYIFNNVYVTRANHTIARANVIVSTYDKYTDIFAVQSQSINSSILLNIITLKLIIHEDSQNFTGFELYDLPNEWKSGFNCAKCYHIITHHEHNKLARLCWNCFRQN